MDQEPNNQQDDLSSCSEEPKSVDRREVVTLVEMYSATELVDLESLEVERVKPVTSSKVVALVYSLTLGVVGSLVASIVFEFYLGRVLRGVLG